MVGGWDGEEGGWKERKMVGEDKDYREQGRMA